MTSNSFQPVLEMEMTASLSLRAGALYQFVVLSSQLSDPIVLHTAKFHGPPDSSS